MKAKLILFIGPDFKHNSVKDIRRRRVSYRCVCFSDEILGAAAAYTMHPDIVICQDRLSLLSAQYIKFKLSHVLKDCRFFIIKNKMVSNRLLFDILTIDAVGQAART